MINERTALIMLEGEVPRDNAPDPHHARQLYTSMQGFANASLQLCEKGKTAKFEEYLRVALKLFRDGNETVKNTIVNVYLFTVSRALDQRPGLLTKVKILFPKELWQAYHQLHVASGV